MTAPTGMTSAQRDETHSMAGILDTLAFCLGYFKAEDEMNAAKNLADVRYSPITRRVQRTVDALLEVVA